MKDVPDNIVTC